MKCKKNCAVTNQNIWFKIDGYRQAISLLETTFFLFIIIAMVGGALAAFTGALTNSDVTQESRNIIMLGNSITKIKTVKSVYPPSAQMGTSLYNMKLLPAAYLTVDGTTIINGWGGGVTLVQLNGGTGFGIGYTGVPMDKCASLVGSIRSGPLSIVGPGSVNALTNPTPVIDVDITTAQSICNTGLGDVYWAHMPQ